MPIVDYIEYNLGTDKEFDLIIRGRTSQEPKDLSEFVGATGDAIKVMVPGEINEVTVLTLDDSPNGRVLVSDVSTGKAGKIHVIFKNAIDIKNNDGPANMSVEITEADGRISKVKYRGGLVLCQPLFDSDH